jgi:hypothetical protein
MVRDLHPLNDGQEQDEHQLCLGTQLWQYSPDAGVW